MARVFSAERVELHADPRWDDFVGASAEGTPFATSAWIELAAAAAGATVHHWIVRKGDEWVAAVAIPHRRVGGREVYVGLPSAAYSSPVYRRDPGGHPAAAISERLAVTRTLLDAIHPRYACLNLFLSPAITDVRPFVWTGWSARPRYTAILATDGTARPSDSVRRHLRKCAEAGLVTTDEWDWPGFWNVFDDTRRRQGFPLPLSRDKMERLASGLRERGVAWMLHARAPGGPTLASHIVLSAPGMSTASMWVAGVVTTELASGVGSWLMMEVAAELGRRGHTEWDLCGADLEGVARFKAELGSRLEHYFEVDAPLDAWGHAYRLARSLVRRGIPR